MIVKEANWLVAYVNSTVDMKIKVPLRIENMNTDTSENNKMSEKPY